MGYTTKFEGELRFTRELKGSEIAYLSSILGEDCRDHPEWDTEGLYYVDLELTEDYGGLRWNGTEKTYDLDQIVNVVIRLMREKYPDFGLTGKLAAQGEEVEDRWNLVIEDGVAYRRNVAVDGMFIRCPECGERFRLEEVE